MASIVDTNRERTNWLEQLNSLVRDIKTWAEESEWATREIEILLEDRDFGKYHAPALLLQDAATKIFLEPVARSAPGVDGLVDLYSMPAYDDIARLFLTGEGWRIQYLYPNDASVATIGFDASRPLTRAVFSEILSEMKKHAAG